MGLAQQRLVQQVARAFPDGLFYKETTERVVALTIDDVPTPGEPEDESTQKILEAIADHNRQIEDPDRHVRATFFIITSHLTPESTIIPRIRAYGHEVANHGIVDDTTALQHPELFALQMREAHNRICKDCNQPIRWYRPGRGLYAKSMVPKLQAMPGYEPRFALASMIPVDTFKPTDNALFSAWYVSRFVFPGSILVMHGGSAERSENTATALPLLLDYLRQKDYRVVTLSELWDNY